MCGDGANDYVVVVGIMLVCVETELMIMLLL